MLTSIEKTVLASYVAEAAATGRIPDRSQDEWMAYLEGLDAWDRKVAQRFLVDEPTTQDLLLQRAVDLRRGIAAAGAARIAATAAAPTKESA